MSIKDKHSSAKKLTNKKNITIISENVGNYEKHPFFVKKSTAAKTVLTKVGLPKQLTQKAHA